MRFLRGLVPFLMVLSCVGAQAATYVVPKDELLIGQSDAIVIARALHSHVEESAQRGIETVTVFAVEEVLKGDPSLAKGIRLRGAGGMVETKKGEKRVKLVPGVPHFIDGNRVLLFVTKVAPEDFATTDLGLGSFAFATDDAGTRVVMRDETEINGWDPDGSIHHEPRRDADRFLGFIRNVVNHRPASENYTIKASPLVGDSRSITKSSLHPRALAVGPVTAYTLSSQPTDENAGGLRWNTFPSAVNFNRGSVQPNAPNSGDDAIDAAFSAWNGDTNSNVNYVRATANANSHGIFEDPNVGDGVNNIVFEKDMTASGVAAFGCGGGGVLGVGGVAIAQSDVTNIVGGETFFRSTEADVSLNQGAGTCLGNMTLPIGNFNSALTHEVGHTLGLRHSSESRTGSQPCTNFGTYDCEGSSAIMMPTIPSGLNATLQAWDHRAIAALYPAGPPPPAPTNVVATAATATSVGLTWTASAGATLYTVSRTTNNSTYLPAGTSATNSFTDSAATANTAYLYKVTATGPGGTSTDSNKDLATTVIFANDPLAGGTKVQAVHLTQLRTAVDAVRKLANAGVANNFGYTDPAITAFSTPVRRIHVIDLRNALDPARATLGLLPLSYTDTTITINTTTIKAAHLQELRNGVK